MNLAHCKIYCCEDISKIENYELAAADDFEDWVVHHRLETEHELFRPTPKQLINNGLYYNRPADELIFMKRSDHRSLHMKVDKVLKRGPFSDEAVSKVKESRQYTSDETRKKLSLALKGRPRSEEHRRKISEARKGKKASEETCKKLSLALKGRTPWNSGKKMGKWSEERKKSISDGMKQHWQNEKEAEYHRKRVSETQKGKKLSEETKRKMSEAHKGKTYSKKSIKKVDYSEVTE
jgi:hypothetical protein